MQRVEWVLDTLNDPIFTKKLPKKSSLDDIMLSYFDGENNKLIDLRAVSEYGLVKDVFKQDDDHLPMTIVTSPLTLSPVGIIGEWLFEGDVDRRNVILKEKNTKQRIDHMTARDLETGIPADRIAVRVDTLRNLLVSVSDPMFMVFRPPTVMPAIWETAPPHQIVYLISYRSVSDMSHDYSHSIVVPKENVYDTHKNGIAEYINKMGDKLNRKEAFIQVTFLSATEYQIKNPKIIDLSKVKKG